MRESEAFAAAARRVTELMEEIGALVREERQYAERDDSIPSDREALFLEKNRMMEQAMGELIAKLHEVEKCSGMLERSEALRVVDELRGDFRETMRLVQETQTAIQQIRDETYREIRAMGLRKNALRAYGSIRETYNGEKGHENSGTAAR